MRRCSLNKTFESETIIREPLPVPGELVIPQLPAVGVRKVGTDTIYESPGAQVRPLPERLIAYATISESINTQHKKILGDYSFGISGALSVGKYENGVSGDIRITPNGLVARNVNGETTLTIDGASGNVTMKGTLQAGSLIAGDSRVVIEGSASGGRMVFYDSSNLPSIFIGYV